MNFSAFSKKIGLPRGASAKWGFTLVELIVVMAISTIIMTALIIQQSRWNDRLAISTQSYELALIIRQAQIFGLGVREDIMGTGDKFNVAYGVNFDIDFPNQYVFFVDKDKDGKLNSGEELETKTFTRGVVMSKICAFLPPKEKCSTVSSGVLNEIPVTFFRPSPNANMRYFNSSGGDVVAYEPPTVIYLTSPKGEQYYVKIEENGQVSTGPNVPIE